MSPNPPPVPLLQLMTKFGLGAAIAIYLVYQQATMLPSMARQLNDQAWVLRQLCIQGAVMAGSPKELCDPPRGSR